MPVDTPTIEDLPVEEIDTGLSSFRLTRPGEVDKMSNPVAAAPVWPQNCSAGASLRLKDPVQAL